MIYGTGLLSGADNITLWRFHKYFDNFAAIFEEMDVVPQTNKREAKEEAKNSSKFCDKVAKRVDQLFCLDLSFLRHCPKREEKVFRFCETRRISFSDE